jgi:uncharacterized protein YigE (DUF2233 family)
MPFEYADSVAMRKRSSRNGHSLAGRSSFLVVLLILMLSFSGGWLGSICYNFFLEKTEIKNLKRSIENLHQELGNARLYAPTKSAERDLVSKTVTDKKGNVFDVFIVDIRKSPIRIYYEDPTGNRFTTFQRVKEYVEGNNQQLLFATNGGMFSPNGSPVGLLIVDAKETRALNLSDGSDGNFYLKPNGVFGLTNKEAFVVEASQFPSYREKEKVVFATQSGPMLLVDGKVHPKFRPASSNFNIRSGVGIMASNQVVFAISEKDVNLYDFAIMFQQQFKCKNALYLDGFISRMYLPALDRYDLEGEFGSIIAVSK